MLNVTYHFCNHLDVFVLERICIGLAKIAKVIIEYVPFAGPTQYLHEHIVCRAVHCDIVGMEINNCLSRNVGKKACYRAEMIPAQYATKVSDGCQRRRTGRLKWWEGEVGDVVSLAIVHIQMAVVGLSSSPVDLIEAEASRVKISRLVAGMSMLATSYLILSSLV